MDKIDISDFEEAVMNSGVAGEFYGEYGGRGGHQGIAVSLDDVSELFSLGAALAAYDEFSELTNQSPHVDSLGTGIIASWPKRFFDAP